MDVTSDNIYISRAGVVIAEVAWLEEDARRGDWGPSGVRMTKGQVINSDLDAIMGMQATSIASAPADVALPHEQLVEYGYVRVRIGEGDVT